MLVSGFLFNGVLGWLVKSSCMGPCVIATYYVFLRYRFTTSNSKQSLLYKRFCSIRVIHGDPNRDQLECHDIFFEASADPNLKIC